MSMSVLTLQALPRNVVCPPALWVAPRDRLGRLGERHDVRSKDEVDRPDDTGQRQREEDAVEEWRKYNEHNDRELQKDADCATGGWVRVALLVAWASYARQLVSVVGMLSTYRVSRSCPRRRAQR